jgi:CheY-like chemotaxis protein
MLPKINGMDVLKQIRAREEYKQLPVIVFSNSYSTEVIQQAWGFGATDVLHKSSTTPRSVVLALIRAIASNAAPDPAPVVATAPQTPADLERVLADLLAQLASGAIDAASAEFLRVAGSIGLADRFPVPAVKLCAALEVLLSTRVKAASDEHELLNDAIRSLSRVAQTMTVGQKVAC